MNSDLKNSMSDALRAAEFMLTSYEEAYSGAEDERQNTSEYMKALIEQDKDFAKGFEASNKAFNYHVSICNGLEELIEVYKDCLGLLDLEMADGRLLDEVFADVEEAHREIESISAKIEQDQDAVEKFAKVANKHYSKVEEAAKVDTITKAVTDKMNKVIDDTFIGQLNEQA